MEPKEGACPREGLRPVSIGKPKGTGFLGTEKQTDLLGENFNP